MNLLRQILTPLLTVVFAFLSAVHPDSVQTAVVMTKLVPPVYPPMARHMGTTGDVKLLLNVRPNGTVESASVISGHPLLQQAALDSAEQSQFACEGCSDAIMPYSLVYTFQLTDARCPPSSNEPSKESAREEKSLPQVRQSQNHVTIVTEAMTFCDPGVAFRRARSAKCLYFWKCVWKP
jgi:TonB family protein